MNELTHIPVLPEATIEYLMSDKNGNGHLRVIDGTVGFGGHSSLILKKNPYAELLGIDHDSVALEEATKKLSFASGRVTLLRDSFSNLAERASEAGWKKVDAILLDIGVSSPQIDDPERGFSFRGDAPLDMRMDRRSPLTAANIVNNYPERELAKIFREYGEIHEASKLARQIVKERERVAIETTFALAEICDSVLSRPGRRTGPPAPTLPFQALRIAVNDELGELKRALNDAVELLNPGGRIVVISFHSLEDRIVKHFFNELALDCKCPPGFPVCNCGWSPVLKILTKKPVVATQEELERNPRSAPAKLRAAEKL